MIRGRNRYARGCERVCENGTQPSNSSVHHSGEEGKVERFPPSSFTFLHTPQHGLHCLIAYYPRDWLVVMDGEATVVSEVPCAPGGRLHICWRLGNELYACDLVSSSAHDSTASCA